MSQASLSVIRPGCSKAFTLMEVIIAISVGAMVMGIVATALSLSVRAWEKARKPADSNLYDLIELLTKQLVFINRSPVPYRNGMAPIFIGKENELFFATNLSPIGSSRNCPVIVHYAFDKNTSALTYREMVMPGKSSANSTVVDEFLDNKGGNVVAVNGVSGFSITYFEKGATAGVNFWEKPGTFPDKVKLEFRLQDDNKVLTRSVYLNLFDVKAIATGTQGQSNVPKK